MDDPSGTLDVAGRVAGLGGEGDFDIEVFDLLVRNLEVDDSHGDAVADAVVDARKSNEIGHVCSPSEGASLTVNTDSSLHASPAAIERNRHSWADDSEVCQPFGHEIGCRGAVLVGGAAEARLGARVLASPQAQTASHGGALDRFGEKSCRVVIHGEDIARQPAAVTLCGEGFAQ